MDLADIPFPQSVGRQQTNTAGIKRLIGSGILLLLLAAHLMAQAPTQFEWRDASGNVRSLSDLEKILREHRQWTESGERSGTRADLSEANLNYANLTNANLRKANLTNAHLDHASLTNAHLDHANLTNVHLGNAHLNNAHLDDANLNNAHLDQANLTNAHLTYANLTNAHLWYTNLTNANLINANLTNAHLWYTNLTNATLVLTNLTRAQLRFEADLSGAHVDSGNVDGAVFEPKSLPDFRAMARVQNLELITYTDNPAALFQLRKQFEDGGLREQERKVTYALKRREAQLSWEGTSRKLPRRNAGPRAILSSSDSILANFASFILNKVFFDWTCQYGMSPGRPLMLGVVLWFLCSLLYLVCIHAHSEAGLYRVYGQSIRDHPSAQRRVERISPLSTTHSRGPRWLFQFFRRECLLLRTSMFFSLMSAFNIGFRDINFGRWLRLLTRQEFDIKAVGWARVIAGWQSLISVYLIALWVLTYFGRPFD